MYMETGRSLYARNDVFGSDYGSRRCGHNAYAPSVAQCIADASASASACNDNDFEHLYEAFRNDPDCAEYFAPIGDPRPPEPVGRTRNPLPEWGHREPKAITPGVHDHLLAVLGHETALKATGWAAAWGGGEKGALGVEAKASGVTPRLYEVPKDRLSPEWAAPLSVYQRLVMSHTPAAYWRLGERENGGNTGEARNFGGEGVAANALLSGGVTIGATSLLGSDSDAAVQFHGMPQQELRVPDVPGINLNTHDSRTVELWFRADTVPERRQVLYEEGGIHRGLNIYLTQTNPERTILVMTGWNRFESDWGPISVDVEVRPNDIYHAALVLDGNPDGDSSTNDGTLNGFFNGVKFGVAELAGVLHKHAGGIAIGGVTQRTRYKDASTAADGANFAGVIDEVAVYNMALSHETLANHYFVGRGGSDLACVDQGFPQGECDSLWCCQWYANCWSGIDSTPCPLKSPVCAVADADRAPCGWSGINKADCKSLNCCWDPIWPNPHNHSWCYHEVGRCDGVCSGVQYLDKVEQPAYCESNLCSVTDCCGEAPTCAVGFCNETHRIDKHVQPSNCKAVECTIEECCSNLGTCPGTCIFEEGYAYKTANLTQYCADTVCTRDECCDVLATCPTGMCADAGWVDNPDAPRYCRQTVCTLAECCLHAGVR